MARSSSTSSSEHLHLPDGKPVALMLAIVLILLAELAVRLLGHDRMLPNWDRRSQYHAAALHMRYGGKLAEVCFIGSSRAREGIHMPSVLATLGKELGHPVSGSNFACPAVVAKELKAITQAILRHGTPELIVCGLSPRMLLDRDAPPDTLALFLEPGDVASDDPEVRRLARENWPVLARNEVGRYYKTLAYRYRASAMMHWVLGSMRGEHMGQDLGSILTFTPVSLPVRGGESLWHTQKRGQSLVTHPVSEQQAEIFVDRMLTEGEYRFGPENIRVMGEIIAMCREHGVPLLLVEIPVADLLKRHWPPGTRSRFIDTVHELVADTDVEFITAEEVPVTLSDEDFLEQSHLNRRGAMRFSSELARTYLVPRLLQDRR